MEKKNLWKNKSLKREPKIKVGRKKKLKKRATKRKVKRRKEGTARGKNSTMERK